MSMSAKNSLLALALASGLAACAVGPDFEPPRAPDLARYGDGDPAITTPAGETLAADWWRLFRSPQLDAVMAEALAHNPSLAAAEANLRQSQHSLRAGYGVFFPSIGVDGGATRQQFSATRFGQESLPSVFNLFTLEASVSYALDLWGGERRMVEQLGAETDLARASGQAVVLTLAANIANTVIAKAAYDAEVERARNSVSALEQEVALAEVQARAGTIPFAAVLALRAQLASARAALPQLQQKARQAEDLLASLAGHAPSEWRVPAIAFADLNLPESLPVSLPSELVRQRPDVVAAEAVAHSASAGIGVATAAMLPNIVLTGGAGGNSTAPNKLFDARGNFWDFGASATQPLFEGGTLWYRRKAAIDTYESAMAAYRQTVLAAFAQVADALAALDHDGASLKADEEAEATAAETLALLQANYQAGLANYLDVLAADYQRQQAAIATLQARAVRYQDSVALIAALGGGWWRKDRFQSILTSVQSEKSGDAVP
jgi:NodT family efflux transporter outer membrane factor (OMF) lipoprotein